MMMKSASADVGEFVSVTIVRHFLDLTAWQGLATAPIMAAVGLSAESLNDRDGWLPVAMGKSMVHAALAMSKDQMFYLKISQLTFLSGYGIIGYLLQSSPTLKDAIQALSRYERLITNIFSTTIEHQPGRVLWHFDCRSDDAVLVRQMTEFHVGCGYLFMLMVKEKRSKIVTAVHFQHAPPDNIDYVEEYGKIFRCPVFFNQPESALVLSSHALNLPLRQVEFGLRETIEAHADRKLHELASTTTSLVIQAKAQLGILLQIGNPSRDALAEKLGVSSRHLGRQLQSEGSSYREILDDLRLEISRKQLRESTKTLDEISRLLSFRDGQSFSRWFRQMTGQTPGDYRLLE
jgi:AraC-like DNA-binding protein